MMRYMSHPYRSVALANAAIVVACAALLFNLAPDIANAATPKASFEVSGWIPYWRTATGTADVLPHLSQLTEINPFGFTVKQDGSLFDAANLVGSSSPWSALISTAHADHVRVIPTVMWSDTNAIDAVLSNKTLRKAHEDAIVAMVNQNGFDGVDIADEGKKASDMPYYAAFLKELYAKMGKKWVSCTIEARTPPSSLYTTIPKDLQYANDYTAINKYCDRVKLMTYDQGIIDLKLDASSPQPYSPIADPAWVTKVVQLAAKSISKSKLVIGVATYGYEYQVMPSADGSYDYSLLSAFNPRYATDLATSLSITPSRNSAGELSFSYVPKALAAQGLQNQDQLSSYAPAGTPTALLAALGAVKYAQAAGKQSPFYFEDWSDSQAIAAKVALAKSLGVRGVALFKFDGGEDPNMWSVLP